MPGAVVVVLPKRPGWLVVLLEFPNRLVLGTGCAAAEPPNNVPACEGAFAVVPNRLLPLADVVVVAAPNSVPADDAVEVVVPKRLPAAGLLAKRPPDEGCVLLGAALSQKEEEDC